MDEYSRQSAPSPSGGRQLPSFSSLSDHIHQQSSAADHARRQSIHDSPSSDAVQALRAQLQARDQTVAMLRAEQDRMQAVHEQLEAKSVVMDRELAALTEERAELRKEANALLVQVERLTEEKELLQQQSRADAAQWQQIMSMSSRLQMQGVEETRRFNSDREAWAREREKMEQKILGLQGGALQRIDTGDGSSVSFDLRKRLTLSSMSDDQLRQEVGSLRERCSELEEMISAVVGESASIERTGNLLREVKRRISSTHNRTSSDSASN